MDLGSSDKVSILKYHPLASGVLAAATATGHVKVWDLTRPVVAITLDQHPEQVPHRDEGGTKHEQS